MKNSMSPVENVAQVAQKFVRHYMSATFSVRGNF